ncbi:MAG: cytochrome c3 family protein [Sphingomonas sp.]|nr:cytochrome c3 family protein [Sphingomonas sp.]
MAFLLRNISLSADGREIVRTSRIRDDLLKVGRDPDCDIRLNDLAVALHHATLEQISSSVIGVSAEAGLTVEIDGSTTQFGQIDTVTGGTIKVGPFLLRVLASEMGSDDVAIDVARADTEEQEDKFDTRRFALATVMPGKRAIAWTLGIVVVGLFLVWPIWSFYGQRDRGDVLAQGFHADQMWSAGALSRSHAALEQNCVACHAAPFQPVQDASCVACHTSVHDHADAARLQQSRPDLNLWGRFQLAAGNMFGHIPGRCVDCHTEHEGPQEMVPTPQQFCADCHTDIQARLADAPFGSAANFETDHPEFQPTVLIRWDDQTPRMQRVALGAENAREASNLKFPHALHLDPNGGVAQMGRRLGAQYGFGQSMECSDCHVPTPDGVRFQPVDMEGDCGMCHSLAFEQIGGTVRTLRHGEPNQVVADILSFYRTAPRERVGLDTQGRARPGDANQVRAAVQAARARAAGGGRAEQAVRQVFSPGGACFECHQVDAPAAGSLAYNVRPVAFPTRYMLHGWFDHRPHQFTQRPGEPRQEGSAACLSCHQAQNSSEATDLMLPDLASCRTCHGGETTRLPVASSCAMCHDYHFDDGVPAMLLRQQVRGRRWQTTEIRVEPERAPRPRAR